MVKIENVLLITDFSENARHALAYARAMAERFGAKFYLLHVIGCGKTNVSQSIR